MTSSGIKPATFLTNYTTASPLLQYFFQMFRYTRHFCSSDPYREDIWHRFPAIHICCMVCLLYYSVSCKGNIRVMVTSPLAVQTGTSWSWVKKKDSYSEGTEFNPQSNMCGFFCSDQNLHL
jgi:hypothetical protein